MIRPVAATDVDGLAPLYAELDDESRYRRFFSLSRPRRSYFEWIITVAERGGAGLVAVIRAEADDSELIVAEAGYELLLSGDGELAITVAGKWRGWLGPYLLDALVEQAASRGVPNLEADVLATNGPMLALLRSRGNAFMPGDDWTVSRMLIGAASRAPSSPASHQRLRLLVEGTGSHWHANDASRQAGLDVLACPGPSGRGRCRPCPALAGQPCPLAAGADATVISQPLATNDWSALRAVHPRVHRGVPVCVELPRARARRCRQKWQPRAKASTLSSSCSASARTHRLRSTPEESDVTRPRLAVPGPGRSPEVASCSTPVALACWSTAG